MNFHSESVMTTGAHLTASFACDRCGGPLSWSASQVTCTCGRAVPILRGIPRFVDLPTHENFSIQWKLFSDVQLDSQNGTSQSRDRLLDQTGITPQTFAGKLVLEVGCGAGRFTEVLLSLGARVVSVDYSRAVEACATTHAPFVEEGRLALAQADVFSLPFAPKAFDVVLGYGMLQHTGDPQRALESLWRHVKPEGLLLVDRYQISARRFQPFKYGLRPITRLLPPERTLSYAEKVCRVLVPIQRAVLRRVQGSSPAQRWVRYLVNRSPNAVYSLNLEIAGKLDPEVAFRWSVLDTFDQYAPKFDSPCTLGTWRKQLRGLPEGEVLLCDTCGQGNTGVVRRSLALARP